MLAKHSHSTCSCYKNSLLEKIYWHNDLRQKHLCNTLKYFSKWYILLEQVLLQGPGALPESSGVGDAPKLLRPDELHV